jgi:hypothetical protein
MDIAEPSLTPAGRTGGGSRDDKRLLYLDRQKRLGEEARPTIGGLASLKGCATREIAPERRAMRAFGAAASGEVDHGL